MRRSSRSTRRWKRLAPACLAPACLAPACLAPACLALACLAPACSRGRPAEAPPAPSQTPPRASEPSGAKSEPAATDRAGSQAEATIGASSAHGSHASGYHKDFSNAEGFSSHFDDPSRDAWQQPEHVLDLMRIVPGSTVVDLGAGTGYFVAGLSRRVGAHGRVLALDVEPKMIEFLGRRVQAQQLENVQPELVAHDDPALPPGAVSRVLIVNTWHHLDERPAYAQKLASALKPDGEIWIVDFTLDSDQGPPPQYRLSAEQVVGELERAGLHAEVVQGESLPKQYVVKATR